MADEREIFEVDATLNIANLGPSQAAHVAGVLNRVVAGLAMEGFSVCLHMSPSPVLVLVGDEEDFGDE